MKKGKAKKNYFKNFMQTLCTWAAYFVLAMVIVFMVTDYAIYNSSIPLFEYFNFTPQTAAFVQHTIALPFSICIIFYVLATIDK